MIYNCTKTKLLHDYKTKSLWKKGFVQILPMKGDGHGRKPAKFERK